jgi:hypothetical protein
METLKLSDFTLTDSIQNAEITIAEFEVPRGAAYRIPQVPFELILPVKEGPIDITTGGGITSKVITTTNNIADNARLPDAQEVLVFVHAGTAEASATLWPTYTVTRPKTITLTGLTAATTYTAWVYYISDEGKLNIIATTNNGGRKKTLYISRIGSLNLVDQYDQRTAPKMSNCIMLPEKFKLKIVAKLTAVPQINWSGTLDIARTNALLEIPFERRSIVQVTADVRKQIEASMVG